ncbi:EF-P lysine aminoacylase EpmA [Candidatus Protochlamydia phocaeensis]|uniref:EF-P lysine aminoacylase EpmA n=1 Tax=Candidatus Protochlamydia phocaeensis TaxID=1414722 RepID=UPI000838AAA3|nr:EF-P lysine aminoacylase EpmA [Candidatus Protochlamydia phocaeensis]
MFLACPANSADQALPSLKVARLQDRALMLKRARAFFDERQVLEVDCPILSVRASVDAHIDLIPATYHGQKTAYLHSSPEYGMKRLLAEGMGDIYQLSHVFRDGEHSFKHNPEFTMAEWYRMGLSLEEMMEETVQFIRLFVGDLPYQVISYRDLFLQETGLDYYTASEQDLFSYIQANHIPFYASVVEEGKDALLNLILGSQIEPRLGQDKLCVLAYYPASQAALARKRWHGQEPVAERFEVYYKGIELANGYHELTDAVEQHQRFIEANEQRHSLGKNPLPIDGHFLKALEKGLPDCCGVAVGFDRLMMLRHPQAQIADVIAWGWDQA